MNDNREQLERIARELLQAKSVAICAHTHPDGDAIGSTIAVYLICEALGIEATPLLADNAPLPYKYDYLYGFDYLRSAVEYHDRPQLFFSVDTATGNRHGLGNKALNNAKKSVAIDHHEDDHSFVRLSLVDSSAASCSMLVWDFAHIAFELAKSDERFASVDIEAQKEEYLPDIALACYTALFTDCGGFEYQNADAAAFHYAAQMVDAGANPALVARSITQSMSYGEMLLRIRIAQRATFVADDEIVYSYVTKEDFDECGVSPDEAENLVSVIRVLEGIEAAFLLRESTDDAGSLAVRGSARAKDAWDVARFARQFNGGGHKAAAGLTMPNIKIKEAINILLPAFETFAQEERERIANEEAGE